MDSQWRTGNPEMVEASQSERIAELEAEVERLRTAIMSAYGCLWAQISADKAQHSARQILKVTLSDDEQRKAIRNAPRPSEGDLMKVDLGPDLEIKRLRTTLVAARDAMREQAVHIQMTPQSYVSVSRVLKDAAQAADDALTDQPQPRESS